MTMREPISEQSRPSLEQAIAAARAGQRDDAVRMLRQVIVDDPHNADAWMWLGGTAPDPREQRSALERAVELAPHNQRAQRGLQWLRETQPQVFEETDRQPTSAEQATAGQTTSIETSAAEEPRQAQTISPEPTTPPRQEAAATEQPSRPVETQPEVAQHDRPDATGAVIYEQPRTEQPATADVLQDTRTVRRVETQPSVHERTTQPMTTQPAASTAPSRPLFIEERRTEEMPLPPPEVVPEYEQAPGANIARWLTIILWCLGLGVAATFAAIAILQPPAIFQQTLQNTLTRVGVPQTLAGDLGALRPVLIGVAIAVAVIDFWMIIGLVLRQRWAWGINLLVALLITVGAVALLVPYFVAPDLVPGTFTANNPAVLTIAGLIGFGVIFLILVLASRRAFRRRPSEEGYGRE